MNRTSFLFSLAVAASFALAPQASAAATPSAKKICADLTQSAKKQGGKKADAKAKARAKGTQALAAAIKRLEKAPDVVNEGSKGKGLTPLMLATALGEEDAIRWLLSIGADPTIKDAAGKDSLSRATDEKVAKLLRQGAIFTWEEALAHLENLPDEAWPKKPESPKLSWAASLYEPGGELTREGALKECKRCQEAAEQNHQSLEWILREFRNNSCRRGDMKMVSFLLRESKTDEQKVFDLEDHSHLTPAELWLPFFQLYVAHGGRVSLGHNICHKVMAENKRMTKWMIDYFEGDRLIAVGAGSGSIPMMKAGLEKVQQEEGMTEERLKRELSHGLAKAAKHGQGETLRFLLAQKPKGSLDVESAMCEAARENQLDMQKLLEEAAPAESKREAGIRSGSQNLWIALGEVRHQDMLEYLTKRVLSFPLKDEDKFALNLALDQCLHRAAYERNDSASHPSIPHQVGLFLLKHGADADLILNNKYVSEERKKLIQGWMNELKGK